MVYYKLLELHERIITNQLIHLSHEFDRKALGLVKTNKK